ncbi:hypothetical protein ACVRW4_04395 [Streptococcus phocae subsp. phocae]
MVVFKDAVAVFGANELYEDGRLGYYTNARDFVVGKIYVDNDNLIAYFDNKPFKAVLSTEDGLKEFTTTKDNAYSDAATYKKSPSGDSPLSQIGMFGKIVINNREIIRVWSNNKIIYQGQVVLNEKTVKIWGSPQIQADWDTIYAYIRKDDMPENVVSNESSIKSISLNGVDVGRNPSVTFGLNSGFYLVTINNAKNASKLQTETRNTLTFYF